MHAHADQSGGTCDGGCQQWAGRATGENRGGDRADDGDGGGGEIGIGIDAGGVVLRSRLGAADGRFEVVGIADETPVIEHFSITILDPASITPNPDWVAVAIDV